jgi:hypothetical protein
MGLWRWSGKNGGGGCKFEFEFTEVCSSWKMEELENMSVGGGEEMAETNLSEKVNQCCKNSNTIWKSQTKKEITIK